MATTKNARTRAKADAKPPRGRKKPLIEPGTEGGEETTESKHEMVRRLLSQIEEKLKGEAIKASVADFIRLLQLERELSEEEAREVVVRWVEPEAGRDSGE